MKNFILFSVCICIGWTSVVFGIHFEVEDIGTLESDYSIAYDVNDHGQICGLYSLNGVQYAFLYNSKDGIQLIDAPESAIPKKINNCGQIIGQFKPDGTHEHAFLWDAEQGFVDLGTLGGSSSYANDLNDYGQVVGHASTDNNVAIRAFVWENGYMTDLGAMSGDLGLIGNTSSAQGINNDGIIVGISTCVLVHKGKVVRNVQRSVIWKDKHIEDLQPNFKGQTSCVVSCTNTGYVFVQQESPQWPNRMCAVNLVTGDEKIFNQCYDTVNDKLHMLTGNIFASEQDLHILNSDATSTLSDPSSIWTHVHAKNMNNNGLIVGTGQTIYGETHAVIIRPVQNVQDTSGFEPEDIQPTPEVVQEIPRETIERIITNTIDGAFVYHTLGIDEKVRLLFLKHFALNQNNAQFVYEPYLKLLMLEALDEIINEIEVLSSELHCEHDIWFWKTVQLKLKEKSPDFSQKVDAYIKMKNM